MAKEKIDIAKMEPNAFANMTTMHVRLTFIEPVLGMSPSDPEIYESYIASKAPDASTLEEELEAIGTDEVMEKQITVFPRKKVKDENGNVVDEIPAVFHYHIKGYFKDTCKALRKTSGTISSNITQYKQIIDKFIFPYPRLIEFTDYDENDISINQRPLRASGPTGERIALAASEQIPAGTKIIFKLNVNDVKYKNAIIEWLEYGQWASFGQWRNSGKGRFFYELLDKDGNVLGGNLPDDFDVDNIEEY